MRFGKNVWYGERPLEKVFKSVQKLGFDYIELSIDYPWPERISEKDFKLIKNLKKDFGLEVAIHAPWVGLCLAHPQKEVFNASLKIVKKALLFSKKLDPLYFNFHLLAPFHGTFKLKPITKEVLRRGVESASLISKLAKKIGIEACLENNPEIFFGSPKQIEMVLKEVKDLKFTLDVGHAVVAKHEIRRKKNPFKKERLSLDHWFSRFKDKIFTIHLSDVLIKGEKVKDHFPIGLGNLNFKKIAKLIKRTKCENLVLEIFRKEKGKVTQKDLKNSLEKVRRLVE